MGKLETLAKIEGMKVMELLERGTFDGVCPGICMNPGCDYTVEVEPDQRRGYCEECGTNTVKAATVLAGII